MQEFFSSGFSINDAFFMLKGAVITILLTFITAIGGTIIGFIIGWLRSFNNWFLSTILEFYIDVIRSVPLVVLFILVHSFSGIIGFRVDPFFSGLVTLNLWLAGFIAEIVRAGIESVPTNIVRAGRSLGLSYIQNFVHIVIPIGVRTVFPGWLGLILGMMKSTSLITVLGVTPPELLQSSRILIDRIQEPLLILLGAGVIYFVMCFPLSVIGRRIEKNWALRGGGAL